MSEEQLTMKCIKDVLDFRTENNDNLWDKIKLDIFNLDQYEPVKKVHFVYRRDETNYFKYMVVSCILKERDKIIGKLIEFSPVPTNRELQAKEEEFIQNVSHELRTPLSAILGSIQILMSGVGENSALGETERKFLSIIKEEGEKFSLILDNIININKISTGEVSTIRNEEINLCDVIEDAALQFKEKAKSKNIKINIELSDKLGSIKGDKMSLFYVFSQLIDNGIKFNKENGEVFISSPGLIIFDNIWQAQITIKDTGIGIDKKDIPHIFDKFYRVENKVHTEHGTGLGLATVKDIIMNHNGMINCKSELGEWTEFKILIPAESML
jgi:signal transduction histidine kinase